MSSVNPFTPNAKGAYNIQETMLSSNAHHMALCFVLDISTSMVGDPIRSLNAGMNLFKDMALMDSEIRPVLDVAIIAFDDKFEVLQNFLPVEKMMHVNLSVRGGTRFAPPMSAAVRMVKDRTKFYREFAEPYKPWIVLITDGNRESIEVEHEFDKVVEELRTQQTQGKLAVRSLGVEGYDSKTLHLLSDYQRTDNKPGWYQNVLKLSGYDFTDFFNWTLKSMAAISRSSPGQAVPPTALQQGGSITVDPWDTSGMG
jgi:uncharacterized protein YegL